MSVDILLEIGLSGAVEQGYIRLYGKSQFIFLYLKVIKAENHIKWPVHPLAI